MGVRGRHVAVAVAAALTLGVLLLLLGGGADPAGAKLGESGKGAARVSISPWSQGVLGNVSGGPKGCAEGRQVSVYRLDGSDPKPGKDKRVGTERTSTGPGPAVYYVASAVKGRLYAKTQRTEQCDSRISKTLARSGLGSGAKEDDPKYPDCSPYVSETGSTICQFSQISMTCSGDDFDVTAGICTSKQNGTSSIANSGSYPWGASGQVQAESRGRVNWNHNDGGFYYAAFPYGTEHLDNPMATLAGKVPNPAGAEFYVSDAWGRGDTGALSGDHLYTPNIPGQAAGTIGGPLYLNFVNRRFDSNRVEIHGYLYLKP